MPRARRPCGPGHPSASRWSARTSRASTWRPPPATSSTTRATGPSSRSAAWHERRRSVGAAGGAGQANGGDHVSRGDGRARDRAWKIRRSSGRVKIKLPTLADDYESDWARVVATRGRRQDRAGVPARGGRRGARRVRARRHPPPVRPGRAVERAPQAVAGRLTCSTTATSGGKGSCPAATTGWCSSTMTSRAAWRS